MHGRESDKIQAPGSGHPAGSYPVRQTCSGITFLDLLIGIAVLGILATIAVPSFENLVDRTRLSTATNKLFRDLALARSEAVRRESRVTLCKSAHSSACTTEGDWSQGWILFAETGAGNATVDGGEEIIAVSEESAVRIAGNTNVADYVSYRATGRSVKVGSTLLQAGTLTLESGGHTKRIKISNTGRAWVQDG